MSKKLVLTGCASMLALCFPAYGQQQVTSASASGAEARAETAGNAAPGQDAGTNAQTVVITATKQRPQILVEAPMSIQAFTGKDLEAKNVLDIDHLISAIPGASQSDQIGEFIRTYSIRGSGTGGGSGDAMIGYYIDDIAFITPNLQAAPPLRLNDIQQVEVLRGPYGTLYGQGAMGGTMIFRTKNPSLNTMSGDAETYLANIDGSSRPSYGAAADLSVPLVKGKLGMRISGGADYRAGYADVYSGAATGAPRVRDANAMHKEDARFVMLWTPNEDLRVRMQYMHVGGHQDYSQQMSSVKPAYFADWSSVNGYEKTANDLVGVSADYDLGFAVLTSATGYINFDMAYLSGLQIPGLGHGSLYNDFAGHSFSQELRLASAGDGPLHWVGGLFYNEATSYYSFDIDFEVPLINTIAKNTTKTRNSSMFGEVSYDLFGGKLVPLVGLRRYIDHRDFTSATVTPVPSTSYGKANPAVTTWRANLAYHPNRETTIYFNAGTGFRSGMTQTPIQVAALHADGIDAGQALAPDRMKNLELGLKGIANAAHLTYEVNLYRLQYTGIQTGLVTSVGLAANASLGDATVRGIDLALQWAPVKGLTIGFTGDRNWSRYDSINPLVARGVSAIVANGAQLLNNPKYTARIDVGYTTKVSDVWSMYTNGSVSRTGARLNQYGMPTEEFSLFDANIGLRSTKYEVELYGQNLSDARGPWFIRAPGMVGGPVPRTVGVRARYHF